MPPASELAELKTLAGLTKSRARTVERSAHELRRLAAELERKADQLLHTPETSEEETSDRAAEAACSPTRG